MHTKQMSNLESSKENLNSSRKKLLETERDLTHLESNTRLSSLKSEIWVWIIKYENMSKDWKYKVFSYTPNMLCFPFGIKQYATNYLSTGNKEWIKITKGNWEEYNNFQLLSAWEKIYIKVPKNTEVQWIPIYENDSKDWEYQVFSYTNRFWNFASSIKEQTARHLGLPNSQWIKITNKDWNEFPRNHYFGLWEKLYIKVPKNWDMIWDDWANQNNNYLDNIESQSKGKGHRDNKDYFDKNKKLENDYTYKNKWIILRRDVWMTFYVMQKKDIQEYHETRDKKWKVISTTWNRVATINYLRNKLWALPEFSYLKRNEYAPKIVDGQRDFTQTFNIRGDFAAQTVNHPGKYYIPIPLDSNIRKIEDKKFKEYAKDWVEELCKKDEPYGKYWKWLNKSNLTKFMTTIAKIETWKTSQQIWTDEYHRWEEWIHDCFSFWPHHVLMEWPWETAYNKLKNAWYFSTEWQTYHPNNSTMRCMGFIVEKMKIMDYKDIKQSLNNMLSFFNKKNVTGEDVRAFAKMYNGRFYERNKYHTRFANAWNALK